MSVASTQYAQKGALYIRNAGQDVALQPGTSGQVLVTKGAEAYPAFEDKVIIVPLIVNTKAHPDFIWSTPGVAYTDAYDMVYQPQRISIPFTATAYRKARLWVNAIGDEAGDGKGFAVYTIDAVPVLIAKVEWDGNAEVIGYGAWNNLANAADITCLLKAKASSASENVTIYRAQLELML